MKGKRILARARLFEGRLRLAENAIVRRGLLFADPEAGTLAPDDERAVIDIIMHALNAAL